MIICIDFDGTCVTHEYPEVGLNIGAEKVLKKLIKSGHKLILNTIRTDENNNSFFYNSKTYLTDAINWFKDNDIELYGINENPDQKYFSKSKKIFAHLYIDDLAMGCPLKVDLDLSNKPFIDWELSEIWLNEHGFINA